MSTEMIKNRGWMVVFAGLTLNLALGILYTWSVFKDSIVLSISQGGEGAFTWDLASLNDPYAVAILVFAFTMIPAGKLQDKKGPRITALIGGLLVGAGFIMISQTTSYVMWVIGFGVLVGMGIGFGYSSATPPAFKWFPASKTGLIAGIVVSGFGIAPVYIAPLSNYLISHYGIQNAMLIFGVAFLIVVSVCALLLVNPPAGYVPVDKKKINPAQPTAAVPHSYSTTEMLKSPLFYLLWFIFFISSGAGLMVIGSISGMAKSSMGEAAFAAVAIMAVGNAAGRLVAGYLSDKIGRIATLLTVLVFQASLMFIAISVINSDATALLIVLLATFIGFNFGSNLSLFPTFTKMFWGMKNFGVNYGFMLTAWGVGGSVFSRLSQTLVANTGSHTSSFVIAGSCLLLCAVLTYLLKQAQTKHIAKMDITTA
jgi:OFA family oxalate/formate antiporter-like MFS transporter